MGRSFARTTVMTASYKTGKFILQAFKILPEDLSCFSFSASANIFFLSLILSNFNWVSDFGKPDELSWNLVKI